jgi:hypothetical protein
MPIRITCPSCKAAYPIANELRGKRIRCRECDRPLVIPGGDNDDAVETNVAVHRGRVRRTARTDALTNNWVSAAVGRFFPRLPGHTEYGKRLGRC